MSDDLIKRSDAIDAVMNTEPVFAVDNLEPYQKTKDVVEALEAIPSADIPSEIIYGNEHNCIMTIFGECSYAETGCGDCAVVEKVRKALSADRPQGEWVDMGDFEQCSVCKGTRLKEFQSYYGKTTWVKTPYCPNCGCRMKGADDADTTDQEEVV